MKGRDPAATPISRLTLTSRLTAFAIGVSLLTVLLGGLLTWGITRAAITDSAQVSLARLADRAAARITDDQGGGGLGRASSTVQVLRIMHVLSIQAAVVDSSGTTASTGPLAQAALTDQLRSELLAGSAISTTTRVDGVSVLIEGRPAAGGGILLVQRRTDAAAAGDRLVRRMLLALAVALPVAAGLAILVARRLARPLRQAAAGARRLADGESITLAVQGPAEVAGVTAALNVLSGELASARAGQRRFLLSVSHDLRTPLTGIRGYAEALADGLVPAEDTARVGHVLVGESARLERLVGDLLDLARLRADESPIHPVHVDLASLGDEIAAAWGLRCAQAQVDWRHVRPAGALWVRTDPLRVRQLVEGLLENALRMTPAGRKVVLEVRAGPAGGAPERAGGILEVRDGGPGLTDDDLGVAFEPAVLHERYRGIRPVGTGLGLAIAARLATLLGGTVDAGHAPEGGARFTVWLPHEPEVGPGDAVGGVPGVASAKTT